MTYTRIHPSCLGLIAGHRLVVRPSRFGELVALLVKGWRPCQDEKYSRCVAGGWWGHRKHAVDTHAVRRRPSGEYECSCGAVWDADEGNDCPCEK